jgi:hypothetical protein
MIAKKLWDEAKTDVKELVDCEKFAKQLFEKIK